MLPMMLNVCALVLIGHLSACIFYFFSNSVWRTETEVAAVQSGNLTPWLEKEFGFEEVCYTVLLG